MTVLRTRDFFKENEYLLATNSRKLYGQYHSHEFFEFIAVLDGEVLSVIDGEKKTMTSGELTLVAPGVVHNVLSSGDFHHVLNVSVTEKEMEKICAFAEIDINHLLDFSGKYIKIPEKEFDVLCENVYRVNNTDADKKILRIKNMVMKFLVFLTETDSKNTAVKNRSVERALKEISNPENLCGGVEVLAELSGYSPSRLYSIMSEEYGITPYKYIEQTRISVAENMLKYSDRSISEIALETGFANQSHFTRKFKAVLGITPLEYRKKYGINLLK